MAYLASMEGVVVNLFNNIYRNRRVLLTGHTGFKGSWLSLWLNQLGAQVSGVSLDPNTEPNHWECLNLDIIDQRADIRDLNTVINFVEKTQPEIVFHLAAQPLVRYSYTAPVETWATNVMGTCHLLEACRKITSVRAIVVVTTDKCYENQEWVWGYRETDRLGGYDPYSASKAGAELVVSSYRSSFMSNAHAPLVATARAGNVIGGGDWSQDRLIPDFIRAIEKGISLEIRSPGATRPWQHVLESLCGYLLLGQHLLEGKSQFAQAWNFGPDALGNRRVSDVLTMFSKDWPQAKWYRGEKSQPHEANLLALDSTRARTLLGWLPIWQLEEALRYTADWYKAWLSTKEVLSIAQLDQYIDDARKMGAIWCN